MYKGISFEIPQGKGSYLWEILQCINVENYEWYNIESQYECYADEINDAGEKYLEKEHFDGKSFIQNIKSNYFILSIKLQAYFKNGIFYDIHTYEEFLESDCQFLLLIYDCEYVEVYIKDKTILKKIFENAVLHKYENIEYITLENDERYKMDVR